jgi:luciferase family oxidoreductase group 1
MAAESFPQDVLELQAFLAPEQPGQAIRAVPGVGTEVPLWILGSSLFGAELAAYLGLPYALASHFAPAALMPALEVYRTKFRPSAQLDRPYAMVGCNVIAAATDAEARRLATSLQQTFANMVRAARGRLPPPIEDIESYWTPQEKAHAGSMLACTFIGEPDTLRPQLADFLARTAADELIVATAVYDYEARKRSYMLLANLRVAFRTLTTPAI